MSGFNRHSKKLRQAEANKMNKTIKNISMVLFGSAAWMVCAVVIPMSQGQGTDGLMAKVSNLVISQAYAEDDKSKSDDESKSKDEGKSTGESSSTYDFSSATLVCVSKTSVLTSLGLSSESSESAKSDDESKSKDEESKSEDGSSKSGDDESSKSSDDGSKDSEAKSSDDDKSKDSETTSSDSTEVTQSSVEALSSCTAIGTNGTEVGVWVPDSAVGNSAALTAYVNDVLAGGSAPAHPDSSMGSYREIRGE